MALQIAPLRDLNTARANTAFAELPEAVRSAIVISVREVRDAAQG